MSFDKSIKKFGQEDPMTDQELSEIILRANLMQKTVPDYMTDIVRAALKRGVEAVVGNTDSQHVIGLN